MMKQVRRWLPGRRLVLVVDGGFAAVSLALACVKSQVAMVSRLRWDAALYHPPGPQPPGKRGPKPTEGEAPTELAELGGALRYPLGDVEVDWYGGQRKQLWVFSRTALWYTPGLPPVAIRYVLVADPEGKLRMEAFFCTDLQATPAQILAWVVMRWSVEVTFEEARAHLGLETQRQWSDQAIARTTPVLLALFSLVTVLALQLSQRRADPGAGDGLVSQSRADLRGLSGLGTSASLACPVFGELYSRGRVHAISPGGSRALDPWLPVSSLIGQSRVTGILCLDGP